MIREQRDPSGVVFDIKEFAVHDGPGIRTTAFLKGCPLRCAWCHNPEGQLSTPQLLFYAEKCQHCGRCREVCTYTECVACGACVRVCPALARRQCGEILAASTLVERLAKHADVFALSGGGVTLSGGEPLFQPRFSLAVAARLRRAGVHVTLDTSGFCSTKVFAKALTHVDLVLFDLKLVDPRAHLRWTGQGNEQILLNLRQLASSSVAFSIRVPLIPGVNDTKMEVAAMAELITSLARRAPVDILPYHRTAGAKYSATGRPYEPGFDVAAQPSLHLDIWRQHHLEVHIGE